jgi:ketopantoate reductase
VKNIPDIGQNLPGLIRPAVKDGHTVIVLIQNGLNIEKPFFAAFPSNIVLSGVSAIDSHEIHPGHIHHGSPDDLLIGAFHNPNLSPDVEEKAARDFIELYSAAKKTDCRYSDNVPWARWRKLVYNASWNPICALTGIDSGSIRLIDGMVDNLVRPVMQEVVATANRLGHQFPDDMVESMIGSDPIEQHVKPSMQIDAEKVRSVPSFDIDY